jgi:hypothetical protein
VHKVKTVYCQSTVYLSLSLLFTVTFKYCFSLKAFPKYLALGIQLIGTCVASGTCLQETASHPLQSDVIKPYHSFLYTELHLKSLKKCLLLKHNSTNSNRDCFLSTECVYVQLIGQHSSEVSGT